MSDALSAVPSPHNEPVLGYAPGSPERAALKARLAAMAAERVEVPCVIGGRDVRTGRTAPAVMPHDHHHVLADVHLAGGAEVGAAIAAAGEAWHDWSRMPWEERLAVFLRAADLLSGPWRHTVNAATMLGQSKTVHQAEVDAACELADFWRFNPFYATQIYADQPVSAPGTWNRMDYRPLEGFVFAVTPFNFTSIAGNLPTAPAMMGDTVVWKPASTSMLSAYYVLRLLEEAGLPPGVVNLVYGRGGEVGAPALAHPRLGGVHFTGSTAVFREIWRTVGGGIERYADYPRIVGETGGKDFIVAHPTADVDALVTAAVRGAFEYQGQKCSAASRLYVPRSLWPRVRERLVADVESIRMGDIADFTNFMGAVIDAASFATQRQAIADAEADAHTEVLVGGQCDDGVGYFVRPTVLVTSDPSFRTMREELFGPVLTTFVYDDDAWDETLRLVDSSTPYGLTGAVFARDRAAIVHAAEVLRHAAGNFYVNDKPTGAVVGQQPFGGSRASGTNDKAGSRWNLMRWVSPRATKELFDPPRDYRYPFLAPDE
ncbi:MAG TPA: L-glutamate gamma-semialdehyde dehydrogenase [Thermoleophilia bacterium]|nr:L-glutamate gamma-semialdehyde dehydrogenase [Thermoleophilia bacterium]HQG54061.1 L-glutamate gamma-semialdehyde dehydrogenase [Thermoleophilia bacterium]